MRLTIRKIPLLRAAVLLALTGGCAEQQFEPPAGDLTGTWFGVRREGTAVVLWQTWKSMAGEIEIRFITCRRGEELQSEHQHGTWEYADGVYRTRISKWFIGGEEYSPGEGADAWNHEYRVLELDESHVVYRHRASRQTYEVRRIAADFQLGCDKIPRHTPRVAIDQPRALDARVVRRRADAKSEVEETPNEPAPEEAP